MPTSTPTKEDLEVIEGIEHKYSEYTGPDAEFGGPEARKALEKRLLLKIDLR
jgi:hypothetical protein